jgi:hypothetical protein
MKKVINATLIFFFFLTISVAIAQVPMPVPSVHLKELWSKTFEKYAGVGDAIFVRDANGHIQDIEVSMANGNQITAFDLSGNKKREIKYRENEVAILSPSGKRFIFTRGNNEEQPDAIAWRVEDSDGNLIDKKTKPPIAGKIFFSPNNSMFIGFTRGEGYGLYDTNGKVIKEYYDDCDGSDASFSPDNNFVGIAFQAPYKFLLLNKKGEKVFEFKLDACGLRCVFNQDGSKIAVISFRSLYVFDVKGNLLSENPIRNCCDGSRVEFLNSKKLVIADDYLTYLEDVDAESKKLESIGGFAGLLGIVNQNLVMGSGGVGQLQLLKIVGLDGKLLDKQKLPDISAGIRIDGNYIAIWGNKYLNLFEVFER